MASINGATYSSATNYSTADSTGLRYVKRAGERGEDQFQFTAGEDKYNLTSTLSKVLAPVTSNVNQADKTQSSLSLPPNDSRSGGPLDSFLRSPAQDNTMANAVYGPFTRSSSSIRGETSPASASAPKARPSAQSTASGIDTYRSISASQRKSIDTFA